MTIHTVNVTTGKRATREYTEKELADIDEAQARDLAIKEARPYHVKRAEAYPSIGDQLDAIMKWVAGENEITVTPELKSIAMSCMSIKSKYPKPTEE